MHREHHPSPASIDRLTDTLFDLAGNQSVRVIEALAAVLTRRGSEGLRGRPSGLSEPEETRRFTHLWDTDNEGRRAICQRIARRALRGSLMDPTRGATAMHRIDDIPAWSRDLLPIGMFGPFLFYRLAPEQLAGEWHGTDGQSMPGISSRQTPPCRETPARRQWRGASSTRQPDSRAI